MKQQIELIIEAASLGQIDALRSLIQEGHNVNVKDSTGTSAVLVAASRNDLTMLQELVKAGATLDVFDSNGYCPLYWAKLFRNEPMTKYIESELDKKPSRAKYSREL